LIFVFSIGLLRLSLAAVAVPQKIDFAPRFAFSALNKLSLIGRCHLMIFKCLVFINGNRMLLTIVHWPPISLWHICSAARPINLKLRIKKYRNQADQIRRHKSAIPTYASLNVIKLFM
jgi:hypothetical protein